jgi:hypothetical protein
MIANMTCQVEYYKVVKRWIPAPVAVFGLLLLPALFSAFLCPSSQAQINGAPASVTSPGFGGRAINGTAASVTSLGRSGYAPSSGLRTSVPNNLTNKDHKHNSHRDLRYGGVYAVPVPVPYAENATDDPDDDANYQGGPTIFDRRGAGAQSYIPPSADSSAPHVNQSAAPNQDESEPAQESTTLVFKDGHQVEVGNYAIVGRTLYDMTPGHPRKVAIADLDLNATEKQNDAHGVTFQLPPGTQTN